MNQNDGTHWNWQLFAEAAEAEPEQAEAATPAEAEAAPEAPERAFTQADIDRIVQRTIRGERQRADRLVEAARTEAARLAGMNAEERARHEAEQRELALNERERALDRRELRAEALETLARRGLPGELADALDYADAERVSASLEAVEAAFRGAVQRGVEARLRGAETPPQGARDRVDLSQLTDYEYYRTVMRRG